MKTRLSSVSLKHNGKVMALFTLLLMLPLVAFFIFLMAISPAIYDAQGNPIETPYFIMLIVPFVYAGLAFLGTVFMGWVYNYVAKKTGGLEFETKDDPQA